MLAMLRWQIIHVLNGSQWGYREQVKPVGLLPFISRPFEVNKNFLKIGYGLITGTPNEKFTP